MFKKTLLALTFGLLLGLPTHSAVAETMAQWAEIERAGQGSPTYSDCPEGKTPGNGDWSCSPCVIDAAEIHYRQLFKGMDYQELSFPNWGKCAYAWQHDTDCCH